MLQSLEALKGCFRCVKTSLLEEGAFVFDLMTRRGFWQDYNGVFVEDTEDELYVLKSVYDGGDKATTRMTGFVKGAEGRWERFEEFGTPTFFPAPVVIEVLKETGWISPWVATVEDLHGPIDDTEQFDRVFFVAIS